MRLFRSSDVVAIAADALDFALSASEDAHPNEYMGLLRGEDARDLGLDREGTVVTDVLIIPGTTSSPVSATVRSDLVPTASNSVGSVHSHPNGVLRPSDQDLQTFERGRVHVIIGAPYSRHDWKAFNREGEPRNLEVVDVELPEDAFFNFTQADIDAELDSTEGDGR